MPQKNTGIIQNKKYLNQNGSWISVRQSLSFLSFFQKVPMDLLITIKCDLNWQLFKEIVL